MGLPEMARYLEVPPSHYRTESSPTPSTKSTSSASTFKLHSLQELNMEEEFTILKILSEGCFSKIILVRPNAQRERLVLKAIHCEATSADEFGRELNYNYFLSPHPSILTSYNVAFLWDNAFVYAAEFAPFGDLSRHLRKDGLGDEERVKSVASQLVSAVEFIHSFHLVHRDIRMENVLVFRKDLSLVKLCDFGHTLPTGSLIVKNKSELGACTCYGASCPPEVSEIVVQERYYTSSAEDVWSLGILIITCLTGDAPWTSAEICDPSYSAWLDWLKRKNMKLMEPFPSFTARFLRLLKRILEPKAGKRSKVGEISKYLGDEWMLAKGVAGAVGRRVSTAVGLERVESNVTSKSGGLRRPSRYGALGKKRSTRSLKLDNELETAEEPVAERVGRWVVQTTINTPT
ncbi:serine/threonine-protein kinase meng-po [Folsomia candida]|uniref:serine/threonine-protein kinase meng-po n=1 Tax=Folsomia candida TaxID=158441 RepID=UPI000B8F0B5F|nr:serine/threonine-protein kinase meng-po [Folsomia candida]XP_021958098.1 serine/threonine-protein kinase meng-po [Folsomia candida]